MINTQPTNNRQRTKLKAVGVIFTIAGIALFAYLIYTVGIGEILHGLNRLGYVFWFLLLLYAVKLGTRALAWTLCVEKPHRLEFVPAFKAVVIGEALSSMIPLGILISGTTKAFTVRNRVPFLVALSAVATENLFYSFATALLVTGGALALTIGFPLPDAWRVASFVVIGAALAAIVFGLIVIVQQWRVASRFAEWLYRRTIQSPKPKARSPLNWLEHGRAEVLAFENRIYGFYRRQPGKFLPLVSLEVLFHLCGILEVWLILVFISDVLPDFYTAFLLESVNRVIVVVFKFVPFVLGVDEAGAQFITDILGLGAAVGVTMAIVRKGRGIIWAGLGILLLAKRGLSLGDLTGKTDLADS